MATNTSLNIRAMIKAAKNVEQIITPKLQEFLVQHGDEEYPEWVVERIAEQLTEKPRVRHSSFSSSSAGQCVRAQVLQFLGAKQGSIGFQLQNIFNDGKWRHLRWQATLLSAGLLTDMEEIATWPRMRARGTLDGVGIVADDHPIAHWRGQEFGFELKGVSAFLFPKYRDAGPKETDHLQQVARYFIKQGYRLFVIIYEDKSTQEWKEWVIDSEADYMQKIIKHQREELECLNDSVDQKKLPALLPECVKLKGTKFNGCPMGGIDGPCASAGEWPQKETPGFAHLNSVRVSRP